METAQIVYKGELRTAATHLKSGNTIITDAPPDNYGKGEAFSPTDLLAASLGSCMLTIMGILADDRHINIEGPITHIVKVMTSAPRRISEIHVTIDFPKNNYSKREKRVLENAALNCPVAKSLHPDIKQRVAFNYSK